MMNIEAPMTVNDVKEREQIACNMFDYWYHHLHLGHWDIRFFPNRIPKHMNPKRKTKKDELFYGLFDHPFDSEWAEVYIFPDYFMKFSLRDLEQTIIHELSHALFDDLHYHTGQLEIGFKDEALKLVQNLNERHIEMAIERYALRLLRFRETYAPMNWANYVSNYS